MQNCEQSGSFVSFSTVQVVAVGASGSVLAGQRLDCALAGRLFGLFRYGG